MTSRSAPSRSPLLWASVVALVAGIVTLVTVAIFGFHGGDGTQAGTAAGSAASTESRSEARSEPRPKAVRVPVEAPETLGSDPASFQSDPWLRNLAKTTEIPQRALVAYIQAAHRVSEEYPECGLGWNTLAGIGFVESEHGTLFRGKIYRDGVARPKIFGVPLDGGQTEAIPDTDQGVLDGDSQWDRAIGPMQFMPETWLLWQSDGNGDGIADPHQIDDAALTAARYLCHTGRDLTVPENWILAIETYNNTIDYNHRVADAANHYANLAATQ